MMHIDPRTRGKTSETEASAPETPLPSAQPDTEEYRIQVHKKARELATLFRAQEKADAFHTEYIEELNVDGWMPSFWSTIIERREVTAKALSDAEIDVAGDEMAAVVDRQRARNQEFAALYESKFSEDATPWWTFRGGKPMTTVEDQFEELAKEPSEDGKNSKRVWITIHPEVSHEDFRRAFDDLPLKRRIFSAGLLHLRPDLAKTLLNHRSGKIQAAAQRSLDWAAYLAHEEADRKGQSMKGGWADEVAYGSREYRMYVARTTDDSEMLKRLSEHDEEAAIRKAARR
ncbi:hypothetical protein ABIB15_002523 [Marisediminicola sp. UYEF4]|uniref:hypothetical protein n=1 Tax=Marisediminicola sp. UYEF4 TaxID=1756384 RepID=UPI003392E2ED